LKPKKPRRYEDFRQFLTQEEKRRHIWNALCISTSEEFLKKLFLENLLQIELSRVYPVCKGSVVVRFAGKVYREINGKYPLYTLRENIRETFLKGMNNENI
jgi:hypothetical protein